jgi:hypothetical protein
MLVALVALCLAMGGTGFAASSLLVSSGPAKPSAANASSAQQQPTAWAKKKQKARRGPAGPKGETGAPGTPGAPGAPGEPGGTVPTQYAEFYALMPPDNAATVGAGTAVAFPNDGPNNGTITRTSPTTFNLPAAGTYRVSFSVSVSEPGQLQLTLDAAPQAYTVSGRATGTSLITGDSLVQTALANSVVSVINPTGNTPALTITPVAGGTHPAAATLIIHRVG